MRHTFSGRVLILACAAMVYGVPAFAKKSKQRAPLPHSVFQAKRVYIENRSGRAQIGDRVYDELLKWGRFQVVTDPKNADLILLLSAREYVSHYESNGTIKAEGTTYDYGSGMSSTTVTGETQSTTTPVTTGRTYMTVIDPRNGAPLWSDSMQWGRPVAFVPWSAWRSAARGLVKEFRDQVEAHSAEGVPEESQSKPLPALPTEDQPRVVSGDPSSVEITSTPHGADITIDGKFIGNTPSTVRLAPGDHPVSLEKAGFTRWQRVLSVKGGGSIRIDATLEKTP